MAEEILSDFHSTSAQIKSQEFRTAVSKIWGPDNPPVIGQKLFHTTLGSSTSVFSTGRKRVKSTTILSDGVKPTPYTYYELNLASNFYNYHVDDWRTVTYWLNGTAYIGKRTFTYSGRDPFPFIVLDAGFNTNGPVMDAGLRTAADVKALNKLVKHKLALSEYITQIRQNSRQIADVLTDLARALYAFRKGRFKDAAKILGLATTPTDPRNWLAYQYGWLPMLNDIYGFQQTIKTLLEQRDQLYVKVHGVAISEESEPSLINSLTYDFTRYEMRKGVEVGYVYRIEDNAFQQLTTLGLTNPMLIAWEFLPYSFVVDWFLNVSNFLNALHVMKSYELTTGYATAFYDVNMTFKMKPWLTVYGQVQGTTPSWSCRGKGMRRQTHSSPRPSIIFNMGLSPKRLANALALLLVRRKT